STSAFSAHWASPTRRSSDLITTISYAPNSFVIGNAYPGWTMDVQGAPQFSRGPGNPTGLSYRWGYLFGGAFDHCAWVGDGALGPDRKSTRLNSSHSQISYAV